MAAYFTYGQRLGDHQIRLIRVHPGHDDQILKCDVVTSDLAGGVEYNALSYVWGNSASCKAVTLNEQKA